MNFWEKIKVKRTEIIFFTGLFIFLIWLHGNSLSVPFFRDEGEYAYSAWLMQEGNAPYINSFLQKPPMIIYTYWLSQLLDAQSTWPPRFLALLSVFFSAFLIFKINKKEFGRMAGFFAAGIFPLLVVLPNFDQFGANTEIFLLLPLLGMLAIYFFQKEKAGLAHWFWAGSLAGAAFFYKYNILPLLIFLFLLWSGEDWWRNKKPKETFKKAGSFILGGMLTALAILVYFFEKGALGNLWEETVVFNFFYSSSGIFSTQALMNYAKIFWQAWWPLIIVLLSVFIWPPKNWWRYLGFFILAGLYAWGSWYGHYYLILMPFLAILGGYAIETFGQKISQVFLVEISEKNLKKEDTIPDGKVSIAIFSLIFLSMLLPLADLINLSAKDFAQEKLSSGGPFLESRLIAEKISQLSAPKELVLVAGSEPQILFYTQRQNVSRFNIVYPLMLKTPLAEKYQKQMIDEIKNRPPKIIALVNHYYSWTPVDSSPKILSEFIKEETQENYEFLGGYVQNKRGLAEWRDVKNFEDKTDSNSVLLYKRKAEAL